MPVSLLRLVTALLLVSFSSFPIAAQQTKPSPDEKPRKIKRELKKAYVEWINDVDLILTQADATHGRNLRQTKSVKSLSKTSGAAAILIRILKRTNSSFSS